MDVTIDDFTTWDGLDDCVIGYVERCGNIPALAYDGDKMVEAFIKQGMDREEAIEWIDFNIAGAYIGEDTPFIMYGLDQ